MLDFTTDYTTENFTDVAKQFAGETDILQILTGNDRETCVREMIQRVRQMTVTAREQILININAKGVSDHLVRVLAVADLMETKLEKTATEA